MNEQHITLTASDGYPLVATVYWPEQALQADFGDTAQTIVIGSATAVPRGFYRRFGLYAASRGLAVVVADYRGIGGSKSGLKNGSSKALR